MKKGYVSRAKRFKLWAYRVEFQPIQNTLDLRYGKVTLGVNLQNYSASQKPLFIGKTDQRLGIWSYVQCVHRLGVGGPSYVDVYYIESIL